LEKIEALSVDANHGLLLTEVEESYSLGIDRRPAEVQVCLRLRALRPEVDRYWFTSSKDNRTTVRVSPTSGCITGREVIVSLGDHSTDNDEEQAAVGVELLLPRPLTQGEFGSFSFSVVYDYHGESRKLPRPYFRRVLTGPSYRHLKLRIDFHPNQLPAHLERCIWTGRRLDPPLRASTVTLDDKFGDYIETDSVTAEAYGWRWKWPASDEAAVIRDL